MIFFDSLSGQSAAQRVKTHPLSIAVIALIAAIGVSRDVVAASGGVYDLRPTRVTSGGGLSNGGVFELQGSVGQHEASPVLAGGAFELTAGLRRRRAAPDEDERIFSDGFEQL